jgi:hypothetical protein
MPTALRNAPVALVLLLAACAGNVAVETPSELPTAAATASPTSGPGGSPDLAEIVISPSDPPAGMGHDETVERRSVLTSVVISGRASEFLGLPGFRDGRVTKFSGESGALLSLGLSFETPQDAAYAFDLFLDELQSEEGYGFGSGPDANLGDEGTCDEGANPALDGLQESICLWRNGSLVLIAGGPIDPEHLRPFAEAMDQAAGDGSSATASGIRIEDTHEAAVDIVTGYGGLTELLGRHPYFVDAVIPGPEGRVDVFMWFDAAVPIEEWPLGPVCEVGVGTDPFYGSPRGGRRRNRDRCRCLAPLGASAPASP